MSYCILMRISADIYIHSYGYLPLLESDETPCNYRILRSTSKKYHYVTFFVTSRMINKGQKCLTWCLYYPRKLYNNKEHICERSNIFCMCRNTKTRPRETSIFHFLPRLRKLSGSGIFCHQSIIKLFSYTEISILYISYFL